MAGGVAGVSLGLSQRWSFAIEGDVYRDVSEGTGTAGEIATGFYYDFGR
jgi:hypothetical protein